MTRGITATQITAALDNPTQLDNEYGWLYSDRPHVVKAAVVWKTPIGLQLAGTFTFQSGARFDRQYDGKGGYQLYADEKGTFDTISAYWQVDLKAIYRLRLPGRGGNFIFVAEMHNLTNNRQATSYSNSTLNSSGEYYASGRQPAMDMEFGLGYEF
jgi:hypothetical protein